MTGPFIKRRERPEPGSIPDALQMFVAEVRFYREIAPVVGVRVPSCFQAEEEAGATLLVLENLSDWRPGAQPAEAAQLLAGMHERWLGRASGRWPWLRNSDADTDLIGDFFDRTWPTVVTRPECTPGLRSLGERLYGHVPEVERDAEKAGPSTLVHGDASLLNMRTSPAGEIALLDWEDVGSSPGVGDLAWLLLSSVEPTMWDETIAAYGSDVGLVHVLPAAASQAILSFSNTHHDTDEALGWVQRIEESVRRIN